MINRKESMYESEIKYYIKHELNKERELRKKRKLEEERIARKLAEQAKIREEQDRILKERIANGELRRCNNGCRHYYEEFLDEFGGVVADFDPHGAGVVYRCDQGHSACPGGYCEYYE